MHHFEFFTTVLTDGFSQEFKWQQDLLSILADFNNAAIWMVFTFPFIFKSSSRYLYLSYLPTPPLGQDITQGQFLSGV